MKKLLTVFLCMIPLLTACGANNAQKGTTEVTEWKAPSTAETKAPLYGGFDIQEEQVKIDPDSTVYETPQATEATEETETTEETQPIPTQGVVNPNGHIPVTTAMGSFSVEDLNFPCGSGTITLNSKIEEVFALAGEDNISKEISENQMEYVYKDFSLSTYINEKGIEKVEKILVKTNSTPTASGVKVGDYASSLVKIYGNPIKQETAIKYYGTETQQLIFKHSNNRITEICYLYIK